MFSRLKQHIPIFAPLGAGLLIITLVTALGGMWQYRSELDSKLSAKPLAPVSQLAAAYQSSSQNSSAAAGSAGAGAPGSRTNGVSPLGVAGSGAAQSGRTAAGGSISTSEPYGRPAAVAAPQTVISVSLSINGHAKGAVRLVSGGNQCEVLSQALAEGVIGSLDMRYISQYGTEGVYVIDGQGDHDVVWWTYMVNGHAPPYGCGYVTARDGDSVNWQYIKS